MPFVNSSGPSPNPFSATEVKAFENLRPLTSSSVPVPFPNFSPLPGSLPVSTKINIDRAQAHGFTLAGANQMHVEGQQPKALPDKMVLARFQSVQVKTPEQRALEPILPTQGKVLMSLMTPELALPPPSPSASSSATSAPTTFLE